MSKYYNPQYDKLTDYEKELITKLVDIKKELDSYLPPYTSPSHRAPQFQSDLFRTVSNLAHSGDKNYNKFTRWFKEWGNKYGLQVTGAAIIGGLTIGNVFTLPATIVSTLVLCCCRKLTLRHMSSFSRTMSETEQTQLSSFDKSKCITVENYQQYGGEAIERDPFFRREFQSIESGKYQADVVESFGNIRHVPIYGVKKL